VTKKLFSERIVDRHRRWWIEKEPHPHKNLAGKLEGPAFVTRCGYKVPELYHTGDTADSLPAFDELPSMFVIKPSRGWSAKNIYVMVNGVNQLDGEPYCRKQIVELLQQNTSLDTDKSMKILVEEYLVNWNGDVGKAPYDFKFHNFGERIAFCHIIERNSNKDASLNRHWYVDEDFNSIGKKVITTQRPEEHLCEKPECWEELVDMAKGLGGELGIFMRIDLYATTRGAVFGEFTPQPQGGKGFMPEIDAWLGEMWEGVEGAGD
jgi:hypothetical protein